ncbi:MAG: hypothetical protein HZR80_14830 [Candidatus Heimdallarchaeota archaeon]
MILYDSDVDPDYMSGCIIANFVFKILAKKIEGTLTDNLLIDFSSLLVSELNLAKNEFNYYLFLNGLEFANDQIIITDEAKIIKYDDIKTKLKDIH